MIIGIDPGWASIGYAVIDEDGSLRNEYAEIPRNYGTPYKFIEKMWMDLHTMPIPGNRDPSTYVHFTDVYLERYVTYGGVQTDPENILMIIGALQYFFESHGIEVHMVRAIDWKPKVCKYLVRTKDKFHNPYTSFDKNFSLLAAREISGFEVKSDHTADAICLGYLKRIDEFNKMRKGGNVDHR